MDPSKRPQVTQDQEALDLVARHAPIIMADELEPFDIIAVGYTIFESEAQSLSFPKRRVEWRSAGYPAVRAIEYALWWDCDIGHLYELEHAWVFLNEIDHVVGIEASWHGVYGQMEINGHPVLDPSGAHPMLLAQPGKHALAATIEPFMEIRETAEREAGVEAGKDGVLENDLFRGKLRKTPENDLLVRDRLRLLAFKPSWNFSKRLVVTREMLVPWKALEQWIPARVGWCLERMSLK
jgi:hypothetical protein